jgi:peptidoglycan/xylan/chitin deacetylase (PgdA/CDA1 family)
MNTPNLLIKRSIKTVASMVKRQIGFTSLASGSVNILAYHRVVADIAKAEKEAFYGIVVSSETFRRHCEMLKKTYDVVSLETAMDFLTTERKVERPLAVITFDDGYLDFYEEAFPVLKELGLPATNFLPTDCIGQETPLAHDRIFWLLKQVFERRISIESVLKNAGISAMSNRLRLTEAIVYLRHDLREEVIAELENTLGEFVEYPREYRLLNWDQVREMSDQGMEFGGHTANHVVLTLENEAIAKTEIFAGKKELEKQLNREIRTFAYPNGEYNAKVRQILADAGYSAAVTTERRINNKGADLLALGRVSLCEESTRGISGVYSANVASLRLGV